MSYDMAAHQRSTREHLLRLVREGGAGWHLYVYRRAEALAKQDPGLHGELPELVRQAIQSEKNP